MEKFIATGRPHFLHARSFLFCRELKPRVGAAATHIINIQSHLFIVLKLIQALLLPLPALYYLLCMPWCSKWRGLQLII
jgi:hypothetical protein